jgi:hypothetical protein
MQQPPEAAGNENGMLPTHPFLTFALSTAEIRDVAAAVALTVGVDDRLLNLTNTTRRNYIRSVE